MLALPDMRPHRVTLALAFLLLTGACASNPGLDPVERRAQEAAKNQPGAGSRSFASPLMMGTA